MPRRQPPKGYYRSSEAEKILNISNAMLQNYVKRGEVDYYVPEGMIRGYYLKKDVDKLANKLNVIMHYHDDDGESTKLVVASKDDLEAITKIGESLFIVSIRGENNITAPSWRLTAYEKNPESQYALKHGESIIGYASILPFKPNSNKIEALLRSELIRDVSLTSEDIEVYKPSIHVTLYIAAIGIKPGLGKEKQINYGASLVLGLIDKIVGLGERGIIIHKMVAVGATHNGIRLLQAFGFSEIPTFKKGQREFSLEIESSGSPVAMQYKQALREYQDTYKNSKQ